MKTAALDTGDRWVGVAIADALGIVARPYTTTENYKLIPFLTEFIQEERISTIVVGLPITMRGTESDQTRKVKEQIESLKTAFPEVIWEMWDERLTSKQADRMKPSKSKDDKITSHARAAALILQSYLERKNYERNNPE
jgi:RNAse H-fold protein YqgF